MSKKRHFLSADEMADLHAIRERHRHPRPTVRQVVLGKTTYHAVSAHELLDLDTLTQNARPGMPY